MIASRGPPREILEADGLAGETVSISGDLSQQSRIYAPAALHLMRGGVEIPFSREAEYIVVPAQGSPRDGGWSGTDGGVAHGVDAGTPPNPGPVSTAGSSTSAPGAGLQASTTGCSAVSASNRSAPCTLLAVIAVVALRLPTRCLH